MTPSILLVQKGPDVQTSSQSGQPRLSWLRNTTDGSCGFRALVARTEPLLVSEH
jgi:hypothetical protein